MAYRIRYGEERRIGGGLPGWAVRITMAAALAACLLGLKGLPGGGNSLEAVFVPVAGSPTEVMAQELSVSGSLREAVVAYCRAVLADAGYAG